MEQSNIMENTIKSPIYGDLLYTEDQVYQFEQGIIGFSAISSYALFAYEDTALYVLHALEDEVSFLLVPSSIVAIEMEFKVDQQTIELLNATVPTDLSLFYIVHIVDDQPYINVKAPILLVTSSNKGCQYIIHDPKYPIREKLIMKELDTC
ncbi:flagellar assembly protein FliW [Paenibacillus yanchengensis]|uniref:Flagellar assembly protein FliW n=1 Tax=Paenibacillus yanchengensis TaxID=2035833 RepID=A0ABW4YMM3_9BACL